MSWSDVNNERREKIENDMIKLAKKIKNNYDKERVSLRCKVVFYLMRMAQKKDRGSGTKDNQYWLEKGWLDDKRPWKK